MRPDIADIRLADRVFAPHYALAVARRLARDATLRADRSADGDALAGLRRGDAFDLLDVTGEVAWGIATAAGLVGYLDVDALAPALPA